MVRTKQINWQQTLRAAKTDRNNVFIWRHGWNAEFLARWRDRGDMASARRMASHLAPRRRRGTQRVGGY